MKHLFKIIAAAGVVAASVSVSQAQYYLAGDFQGWNPATTPMAAGPNANEYSYTITGGTAGSYANVKVTDGTWNNTWPSQNMMVLYDSTGSATVHFWPGASTDGWQPTANRVGYDDPDNDLGWGIAGDFNGYDGTQSPMQSLGNGLYTNNITAASAGSSGFQFQSPAGSWNNIHFGANFGNGSANGGFLTTSSPQTLPVALDLPNGRWFIPTPPPPTNNVTFQVDMSAQVLLGNFTNGSSTIAVTGNFGGPWDGTNILGNTAGTWDDGLPLTNNPTLSGTASNIYSGTHSVVGYLPDSIQYKFRMNGGWEGDQATTSKNREATITNPNQVLSIVYYNNNTVYDLLPNPVTVTFTLYMPNGAMDENGYTFNNQSDTLWINGDFINNWNGGSWPGPISSFPANQQLIEVGLSDFYTNSFILPKGNSVYLNYKYSIDSTDDENGFQTNHVRLVRTSGPTYNMPVDQWSWSVVNPTNGVSYPNPGISSTNVVEPDFGYLAIQPSSAGRFPITWLGRPGVVLQNTPDLTSGSWNTNNGTDGTQATNWPNLGGSQFFRLMKKQ